MAISSAVRVVSPFTILHRRNVVLARFIARVATIALLAVSISSHSLAAPVDVNTADAQSLSDALVGIGPAIAKAIVDYREENGPFAEAEELLNVKGVGPKTLERNKEDIITSGQTTKSASE